MSERQKRPISLLFAKLDPSQREHYRAAYEGSSEMLRQTLGALLESKIAASYGSIDDVAVYEKPQAQMFLADQAGYRRALKEVLSLLP